MVGADDVDRAVGQSGDDGVAVARAAQRRIEPEIRIEVTDVAIDQMHMVNRDIGGDGQPFPLGLPDELDALADDKRQM